MKKNIKNAIAILTSCIFFTGLISCSNIFADKKTQESSVTDSPLLCIHFDAAERTAKPVLSKNEIPELTEITISIQDDEGDVPVELSYFSKYSDMNAAEGVPYIKLPYKFSYDVSKKRYNFIITAKKGASGFYGKTAKPVELVKGNNDVSIEMKLNGLGKGAAGFIINLDYSKVENKDFVTNAHVELFGENDDPSGSETLLSVYDYTVKDNPQAFKDAGFTFAMDNITTSNYTAKIQLFAENVLLYSCVEAIELSDSLKSYSTISVTNFKKVYKLTYNIDDEVKNEPGFSFTPVNYIDISAEKSIESLPVPVRDGYMFLYWYKEEDTDNDGVVDEVLVDSLFKDTELYVKWAKKTYDVTSENIEKIMGGVFGNNINAPYVINVSGNISCEVLGKALDKGSGKYFTVDLSNATLVDYNGDVTDTFARGDIGDNFDSLKNIILPKAVKTIDNHAFNGSENLESVKFAEECQLTAIGFQAFYNCKALKEIELPASLETIGSHAFDSCEALKKIELPASLKTIESNAFAVCKNLESVKFAENSCLTSIGIYAFDRCNKLTEITIPASLTTIKDSAFMSSGLKSVTFESGSKLEEILVRAFFNCHDLEEFVIPDSVTTIGEEAFSNDEKLSRIHIGKSVNKIGAGVFDNCPSLTTVTIDSQNNNFILKDKILYNKDCTEFIFIPSDLTTLTIPKSMTTITPSVLQSLPLEEIVVENGNTKFKAINGVLYNYDGTEIILYPANKADTAFEIPDSVKTIKENAFGITEALKELTIGANVDFIEYGAFRQCSKFTVKQKNELCWFYCPDSDKYTKEDIIGYELVLLPDQLAIDFDRCEKSGWYARSEITLDYYYSTKETEFEEDKQVVAVTLVTGDSLNVSDGTWTIISDKDTYYVLTTELGKSYKIGWVDGYNYDEKGIDFIIENNDWELFEDSKIYLCYADSTPFPWYEIGSDEPEVSEYNDDEPFFIIKGTGRKVYITVSDTNCAFRISEYNDKN